MRARPHPRGSSISEDYQPSVDARTEPASLVSPQPPVEAIGRALPSTSTCAELANPIDSASAFPAVTENPVQIDTLLDAQGEPELPSPSPPQPPAGAIGRAPASTSTCVELPNLIDSASGSPADGIGADRHSSACRLLPARDGESGQKTLFRVQIIARRANASAQHQKRNNEHNRFDQTCNPPRHHPFHPYTHENIPLKFDRIAS